MTQEGGVELIQDSIKETGLLFTVHATDQILEEDISTGEIREAIFNGTTIEDYPEHRRGPCCLVYGRTNSGRNLHVVVTKGKVPVRIITAYEPKPPYWVSPTERGRRV